MLTCTCTEKSALFPRAAEPHAGAQHVLSSDWIDPIQLNLKCAFSAGTDPNSKACLRFPGGFDAHPKTTDFRMELDMSLRPSSQRRARLPLTTDGIGTPDPN